MGKLVQMRVFLHGLRGVGIETAKNLILAGPKQVVIHDDEIVSLADLASNFYTTEADVGKKTRAQACLEQLKQLNPYVNVSAHSGEIKTEFLANFDVVVMTDFYNRAKLIEFNNFCHSRDKPIGFIYGGELGLYGFTFVDYGPAHVIFDKTGEENKSTIVVSITNAENGVVTCHEDKRHGFVDGDYVIFREVQGMTEINDTVHQIKVLSPFTFSIGDTSKFSAYSREGIAEQTKKSVQMKFKTFEESLISPYAPEKKELDLCDWEKIGRPEILHVVFTGLLEFVAKNGSLPELNNQAHAEQLLALVEKLNEENKGKMDIEGLIKLDGVDKDVVFNVANFARAQISPLASFWGGIIAQEIVKFTGKFTPLSQWLHYEVFEALPEQPVNRKLQNCRYDDNIAIFGIETQDKMANINTFLIGAGALGCEYIKMLSLLGMCCGNNGLLHVTDDDNIEVSNLNRQFLFRKENVGHSKAQVATEVGKRFNEHFKSTVHKSRVGPDSEELFSDDFWDSLHFVINAVDNVKARLFVDSRCVFYGKALFESGTLGTKCNSQVVIPKKTQCYGDSQDPPEESIPLCTLKNFPHLIDHTIQWARDYFEGEFVEGPNECGKFVENPTAYVEKNLKELKDKSSMLRHRFETVHKFALVYNILSFEKCIELAKSMFVDVFHNMIAQLLYSFPLEHKTEGGQPFWSGPKRPPTPIVYDAEDPTHLDFVLAAANIFANIFGLKYNLDREYIKAVSKKIQLAEFKPKKATAAKEGEAVEVLEDDETVIKQLADTLSKFKITGTTKMNSTEFEKDDDSNHHIDFVAATANLRARNYKIAEVPRIKVKLIAGKIIPAIATATAMIVGAVGMELIKYILDKPIEKFKNSFMNLALPLWLFSEPLPPIPQKDKEYDPILLGPVRAIPQNFTIWDKIIVPGPKTVKEFKTHMQNEFKVDIALISCGKTCLFNKYAIDKVAAEKRLNTNMKDLFEELANTKVPGWRKYLELEISGENDEGIDCVMPTIKYALK